MLLNEIDAALVGDAIKQKSRHGCYTTEVSWATGFEHPSSKASQLFLLRSACR